MDPNENLKEQRKLADKLIEKFDEHDWGQSKAADLRAYEDLAEMGVELAEYAEALDTWLDGGGFLPDAWDR